MEILLVLDILLAAASGLEVVLVLVTMLAILKLPGLLERLASQQQQTQQVLRDVLVEIRSVTRQQ